ncbi:MAG: hypothetical protein AB1374_09110 [Bacillota bacterium]
MATRKLILLMVIALSVFALTGCGCDNTASGGKIKLTIVSKTDQGDWGNIERCTHHYSVSGAGADIPKTPLPHNQTTVVELPATRDSYTLTIYTRGVYADGKTPGKPKRYVGTFPGNKPLEITFTCDLRGGMHGTESKSGFTFTSYDD